MELQTIFTQVIQHLVRQDDVSLLSDEDTCAYRGGGGDTKCAVGYLISDKYYDEVIESNNLNSEEVVYCLTKTIGKLDESALQMLRELQNVHDFAYNYLVSGIRSDVKGQATVVKRDVELIATHFDLIVPRAFYDWLAKYAGQ